MFRAGIAKLAVIGITTATLAGLGTLAAGPAFASAEASGHVAIPQAALVPMSPQSNLCVDTPHVVPCWATTVRATTLTLANGRTYPIGDNDLVEIQCYYTSGATTDDHVIRENAGSRSYDGHINDNDINLGGKRPNAAAIHIPHC